MYIATKEWLASGELYAAPAAPSTTAVNALTPVRSVPPLITSADFAPDGEHLVLLSYLGAYWADSIDGTWHAFDVPQQPQNEAIAFDRGGGALLVGSEGNHATVYRVALPWALPVTASSAGVTPAPSPPASTQPSGVPDSVSPHSPSSPLPPAIVAALVGLGVVLLGGLIAALVIRRRRV